MRARQANVTCLAFLFTHFYTSVRNPEADNRTMTDTRPEDAEENTKPSDDSATRQANAEAEGNRNDGDKEQRSQADSNPQEGTALAEEMKRKRAENLRQRIMLAHRNAEKSQRTWMELADSLAIVIRHLGGKPETGFASLARMGGLPRMDYMGAGDVNFGMPPRRMRPHRPVSPPSPAPGSPAKLDGDDQALAEEMNEENHPGSRGTNDGDESDDGDPLPETKQFPQVDPERTTVRTPKGSSVRELHTRNEVISFMKQEAEKAAGHPLDDGKDTK